MRSGKTNKGFIIILIAFAIGWFSLYSIINFHQHRIFGEELKYNVYPSLCKKEESLHHTFQTQKDKKVQLENNKLFTSSSDLTIIFQQYSKRLNIITSPPCLLVNNISPYRLRGPPSVS